MEPRGVESIQRIPSDPASIKKLIDSFMLDLASQAYDPNTTFTLALGFSEAAANALNHGNKRDPSKYVTVTYRLDPARAELVFQDEGQGFDPDRLLDATSDEGLARPGGRGVFLMRAYFDDVQFLHSGRAVRLTLTVPQTNERAA